MCLILNCKQGILLSHSWVVFGLMAPYLPACLPAYLSAQGKEGSSPTSLSRYKGIVFISNLGVWEALSCTCRDGGKRREIEQ